MKYGELINFQPITSVIQLTQTDNRDKAQDLVRTYVASDRMTEQMRIMVNHLQFAEPEDNRGILIVGNYGTGKSHLMSVMSAIAESQDLLADVQHPALQDILKPIAGQFQVIRMEMPAATTDFYTIVTREITRGLAGLGIAFEFPPLDKATSNKDRLMEMMGRFNEAYPDHGLLVVIDELLDYLRARKEQELVLDLGFLREIGEVAGNSRLRIIGGIQEMLFGNPRFQFVAQSLHRVQARFQQIHIVRDDVAFVVSERLLRKNGDQKAWIRGYLETFRPLYPVLSQRFEHFVDLFPVHPRFFDVFNQVSLGEKREILKTLTTEIRSLMDQEVPADQPRLIAYDQYWQRLEEDSSLNTQPDFERVRRRTRTILDKLGGITKAGYRPVAERIVAGLAVQRLAVDSVTVKMGPTVAELKDDLLLYLPVPMLDSDFLTDSVRSVLNEIRKVLGGQFIHENPDNGQFYIELEGGVDFDELIRQKMDTLDDETKNSYYFEFLQRALELTDSTYAHSKNPRTWEHRVVWLDHHVERAGYLFFGPPNERSTVQPPREFYLYFLELYKPTKFTDPGNPDEVFFRLEKADSTFDEALNVYAAARELIKTATTQDKKAYEERVERVLKTLSGWLTQNFTQVVEVTYQRRHWRVSRLLKEAGLGQEPEALLDLVNVCAAYLLNPAFTQRFPDYPSFRGFPSPVSLPNLSSYADEALGWLTGNRSVSKNATLLLHSLGVLEGTAIRPLNSPYAKWVMAQFDPERPHAVVNRDQLLETVWVQGGVEDVVYSRQYRLEPELFFVVLAALVADGRITLTYGRKAFDATTLGELRSKPWGERTRFDHIAQAKAVSTLVVEALFEFFDLGGGRAQSEKLQEDALQDIPQRLQEKHQSVTERERWLQNLPPRIGPAVTDRDQRRRDLETLHQFLDQVGNFLTPGRLKSLPWTHDQLREFKALWDRVVLPLEQLESRYHQISAYLNYLERAQSLLAESDPWGHEVQAFMAEVPQWITSDAGLPELLKTAKALKTGYVTRYTGLHHRHRLTLLQDEAREKLKRSEVWGTLTRLQTFFPQWLGDGYTRLERELINQRVCTEAVSTVLETQPECPECHFRPAMETTPLRPIADIEEDAHTLLDAWVKKLVEQAQDPMMADTVRLLEPVAAREAVHAFIRDAGFSRLPPDDQVLKGLAEVLKGLDAVEIPASTIIGALADTAWTLDALKQKMLQLLDDLAGQRDPSRLRFLIVPNSTGGNE